VNNIMILILSVWSWSQPQPTYSQGRLFNYGDKNRVTIEANARFHGYTLAPYPNRCGMASISPAMLGRIAWVRTPGHNWIECLVVDVDGRDDAYRAIYRDHEIAEVPDWMASQLGFSHGADGYVFFGVCPPRSETPQFYAPPLVLDTVGEVTPSFFPYSKQEKPVDCKIGIGGP
jgi:hypothetical protein